MMEEVRRWAIAAAKDTKVNQVRQVRGRAGETDILTVVMGFRGDEPIVNLFMPPHRDWMLHFANLVANGFSCDEVVLTLESYVVVGNFEAAASFEELLADNPAKTNPDTGKDWEQGDMQRYFEAHGTDGVVSECLNIMLYNRAGDAQMVSMPYRIEGREVIWTREDVEDFTGGELGGLVADAMAEIMARETMLQAGQRDIPAEFFPDHDEALWIMDKSALKVCFEHAAHNDVPAFHAMLAAEKGSPRHQKLKSLQVPNAMIVDPRKWLAHLN